MEKRETTLLCVWALTPTVGGVGRKMEGREQIGRLSQANRRDNMKINQANANTHATPERNCHALEKKIFFLN